MRAAQPRDCDFVLAAVGFDMAGGRAAETAASARTPDLVVLAAGPGGGSARAEKLASAWRCAAVVWGGGSPAYITADGIHVLPVTDEPAEFGRPANREAVGAPSAGLFVTMNRLVRSAPGFGVYVGVNPPRWEPDAWLRPKATLSPFPRFFVCPP